MGDFNAASGNTERRSETWLTPPLVLDSLGGSDAFCLDPCAAPEPRPWDTARSMSGLPVDGLTLDWPKAGVVWVNPPYKTLLSWCRRCAEHKADGGSAMLLLFSRTETRAFQEHILPNFDLMRFLQGRLRFCRPDGKPAGTAVAPSVLIAMGGEAADLLRACTYPGHTVSPMVDGGGQNRL